ncbi:MAG TPA: nucleotidyl transferase AbiEii/AbiGii toxin family protein [Anaerolineales bacterium]|nr:nucleotidyl transferase AbiEii/AbiGii toxin family protein [Anaerolineales bacterium]
MTRRTPIKDFYDIWMLITNFEFDGRVIQTAIERVFQNRSTELPDERHTVFSDEFAESKRDQWNAFSRKSRKASGVDQNYVWTTAQSC